MKLMNIITISVAMVLSGTLCASQQESDQRRDYAFNLLMDRVDAYAHEMESFCNEELKQNFSNDEELNNMHKNIQKLLELRTYLYKCIDGDGQREPTDHEGKCTEFLEKALCVGMVSVAKREAQMAVGELESFGKLNETLEQDLSQMLSFWEPDTEKAKKVLLNAQKLAVEEKVVPDGEESGFDILIKTSEGDDSVVSL